jgi:hypothetical protein
LLWSVWSPSDVSPAADASFRGVAEPVLTEAGELALIAAVERAGTAVEVLVLTLVEELAGAGEQVAPQAGGLAAAWVVAAAELDEPAVVVGAAAAGLVAAGVAAGLDGPAAAVGAAAGVAQGGFRVGRDGFEVGRAESPVEQVWFEVGRGGPPVGQALLQADRDGLVGFAADCLAVRDEPRVDQDD